MSDVRFRFGAFEFDAATGELRRDGLPLRLQAQPAKVLAELLEQSGEIVSRETLRQAVWGQDTHVDFERGLNFCLAQIRSALDDSADAPRYIRTVPKRGYRFIAPVSRISDSPGVAPPPPRHRRRWLVALPAVALALAAILLAFRGLPSRPAVPIAVVPFDNETGSPDLDRYAANLSDLLVTELTTHTSYAIVGNAAILRQPRPQRDLRAIGAALGARYIIIGQVQRDGNNRRVLAHLIHLPDQVHLWVVRTDFPSGDPPPAAPELARRIRDEFASHLAATHKSL